MEPEKDPNRQGIVKKVKQSWGHHVAWFQAMLQSCDWLSLPMVWLTLSLWKLGSGIPPLKTGQGLVTALINCTWLCDLHFESTSLPLLSLCLSWSPATIFGGARVTRGGYTQAFQLKSQLTVSTDHRTWGRMSVHMTPAWTLESSRWGPEVMEQEGAIPTGLSEFLTHNNLWELINNDCYFKSPHLRVIYYILIDFNMPRISFLFFPWVISFTLLLSSYLSHHQFSFASVSPIISSSFSFLSMFSIVLSAAYWASFSGCSSHSLLHRKTLSLFLLKFMSLLLFPLSVLDTTNLPI